MSTPNEEQFKRLLVSLPVDKKKALTRWCLAKHSNGLPVWFAQHATEEEQDDLLNAMNTDDYSPLGINIDGAPASAPVEEAKAATPESPQTYSDEGLKELLRLHGYEPTLKKVTEIIQVTGKFLIHVPKGCDQETVRKAAENFLDKGGRPQFHFAPQAK